MMVTVRPAAYGELFSLSVLQLPPSPSQECYRSAQSINYIHGNKSVIQISGFPHVWMYTATLFC